MSIQAQVINLLQDLQREFNIAFLFIAHDLAVVRHFCPEVAVMYLGKIVEIADRETLYNRPQPPLHAGAALGGARREAGGDRRSARADPARGRRAQPDQPASGCRFRTRCPLAQEICARVEPPLLQIGPRHKVACHFAGELGQHPDRPVTAALLGVDDTGNPTRVPTPARLPATSPATPTPGST